MAASSKKSKKHAHNGRLVFERSSFHNDNEKHKACIADHYFNSAVQVLCPNLSVMPEEIDSILSNQMSFLAKGVSLESLLTMEFIEAFVKRGDVYMLSHGTCIDAEDCVALLPTGLLILDLTKDTFQQLGLEGKLAKYGKTYIGHEKYVVEIDLLNKTFFPDMKHYERVRWCFTDRLDLHFDFLLSWKPSDPKVCPSSIQNYFQSNQCVCNRLKIPKRTMKYEQFKVPIISPDVLNKHEDKKKLDVKLPEKEVPSGDFIDQSDTSCGYLEVFDWLGACAAGIELDSSESDKEGYVSSFLCPSPNKTVDYGTLVEYRGLITPIKVQAVVDYMRTLMADKQLPWCSMNVHGFADSPVSWQKRLHGFYNNGDNLYSMLMFKDGSYWLYKALGGRDVVI